MECILCHVGKLKTARIQITMEYAGKQYTSPVFDGLICSACGEQYTGEAGAAFLMFHRNQAPDAKMSATFTELEEE